MRRIRRAAATAALGGALALGSAAAQEADVGRATQAAPGAARQAPEPVVEDEIIVLGRIGALRHELEIAEDAMFDRFNQIVGDPKLEIHCRMETKVDSHIPQRVCVSNDWRHENANIAQAVLGQVRGEMGAPPEPYYAAQLRTQQHLGEEMRRLAAEDPQLHDAIIRVGEAQNAIAGETGKPASQTASLEMQPGDTGLPFDAKRAYEVRVGKEPWTLPLTERTFTIASVTGEIRGLRVKCDRGNKRIDYRPDVDWTLPPEWQSCSLRVDAKAGTTFAFYEFQ
jgi:hypothetical protein